MSETQAASTTNLVGTVVGGYRLVTELGSGGMGTVYYGEHTVIGRRAAIKILRPEVSRDHQIVARFLTEARSVNDIRHPNVVEITDLGRHGELYFIVMSFLEGETLGERLERDGACDEATAIRIVKQVTSALGTAHERGIVHRDLKPENIFITNHPDYPDYVKVLDFGIAKLIGPGASASNQTAQGMIIGTPAYMSPEQCRGQAELDHRSDIYSLGVVLYQMLTGRVPFAGPGVGEIIVAHVTEPPTPPIDLNPKISPHVSAAILRAMEKDPARRFATMREMREALEPASAAPAAARPVPGSPEDKKEAREAFFVVNKLVDIVMKRLAADRLVVPAMPTIATECMEVLKRPNHTFKTVAEIVSKDPLLASRVLRLANSAAFPSRVPATTVEQAIARMGTDGLVIALVKFSMHQAFVSKDDRIRSAFRGIWEHSLAVALLAKDLAERMGPGAPNPNVAYLGGLLHDVGKPVVAALLLEAERLFSKEEKAWLSPEVWKRVVDESHRRVGTALARKWKLPDEISRAIESAAAFEEAVPRSTPNLVRLANALAKRQGLYVGAVDEREVEQAIAGGRALLGLSEPIVNEACRGIYGRVGTLLDAKPAAKVRAGAQA